jgi:hypothetical protein
LECTDVETEEVDSLFASGLLSLSDNLPVQKLDLGSVKVAQIET